MLSKLLSAISWRTVRVFGGLQVLTKASYFLLVFVPILAAVWPAIRGYINRYNQSLVDIASSASELAEALEQIDQKLLPQSDTIEFDFMLDNLHRARDALESVSFPSSDMPEVWAVAFFAALLVVVGHAIYESFAPDLVKRFSQEEFSAFELSRYSNHPTEVQLERAREVIDSEIQWHNERQNVPYGYDAFDEKNAARMAWSQEGANPLDTIALAANIEYEKALGWGRVNLYALVAGTAFEEYVSGGSGSNFLSRTFWTQVQKQFRSISKISNLLSPMIISFAAYFCALLGIGWIVLNQSVSVMEAAGWNVPELILSLVRSL